ncbi:insulinase family protein, partial [candidate division KSB1 bacterium]|nr:insulinase family protein [candidate division KSB1 bacterium]
MKQIFSILFFLNFTFSISFCQTSIDLKKELPTDPKIRIGKLKNGLKYYIRENQKPENRAELRLAVNAGSVLEDDDQRGLAHFVEHMAFNGTKNFAKQEIVDYLESIGMQFGPDINAYTDFDETVYMLQVPTDSVEAVETAFQILEDWAHNISFEEEEIDKERGVVVEEWRLGRGAGARMRDKQFPILFKDSRYAERLPIGKKEILETAPYNSLRRFYRDWYRPDLMAVVAVGDFDKDWIEKLIKKHFRRLRALKKPRERQVFPVPNHKETLFAPASDVEATSSNISIYYKHEVPEEGTVGDYRRSLIEALYNSILNNRLNELLQNPEPPFLFGFSSQGTFIRSKSFYILGAGVKDNGIEAGLEAVLTEAIRVRRHGFTESELERQKTEMLRRFEQVYNERDKTESEQFAAEYIRNFLEGEPLPGIEYEYTLYNLLLPGIKIEEVNQLAKNLIRDENRVISVSTPEKEEIKTPTEEGILAVFDRVNRKEIKPYEDTVPDLPLVEIPPTPGKIVAQETIEKLGVTEWDLSNGVKVVLKPTDFKNDEILFTATSPGGHSLVPDKDFIAAALATAIIREGGLGNFDRIALQKKLAGKLAGVSAWISSLQEGLSGNASPKDLETLFELIYLHFTAPRKDN